MKEKLAVALVSLLIRNLDPEDLKKMADTALDFLENKISQSPTKIDDRLVLPLIRVVREAFNIE